MNILIWQLKLNFCQSYREKGYNWHKLYFFLLITYSHCKILTQNDDINLFNCEVTEAFEHCGVEANRGCRGPHFIKTSLSSEQHCCKNVSYEFHFQDMSWNRQISKTYWKAEILSNFIADIYLKMYTDMLCQIRFVKYKICFKCGYYWVIKIEEKIYAELNV